MLEAAHPPAANGASKGIARRRNLIAQRGVIMGAVSGYVLERVTSDSKAIEFRGDLVGKPADVVR